MSPDTSQRLDDYPYKLLSELKEAANEHGYRIGPDQASGWLFFRSASVPGEIAIAATSSGMDGPFYVSVFHPGAAKELKAVSVDQPAKGAAAAFQLSDRTALRAAISEIYRFSLTLPTFPLERYLKDIKDLGDTEAERLQKVRIGQSHFRDALMGYWNGLCPITGIREGELLRASHIVPWAKCASDAERLDVHNGLLLSSLWDAAFDAGLITFDVAGIVVASPRLTHAAQAALGLSKARALVLSDEHQVRLEWHRANVWKAD